MGFQTPALYIHGMVDSLFTMKLVLCGSIGRKDCSLFEMDL
jgi:hypothetical protein